jgi:hypothetical protein
VTLRPLVLLSALFLEDYDLLSTPVADNRRFNGSLADFGIFALADYQRGNINLCTLFAIKAGHTKRLTVLNCKLFAACFDYCVTHFYVSIAIDAISVTSRKAEIIRKTLLKVKLNSSYTAHLLSEDGLYNGGIIKLALPKSTFRRRYHGHLR